MGIGGICFAKIALKSGNLPGYPTFLHLFDWHLPILKARCAHEHATNCRICALPFWRCLMYSVSWDFILKAATFCRIDMMEWSWDNQSPLGLHLFQKLLEVLSESNRSNNYKWNLIGDIND